MIKTVLSLLRTVTLVTTGRCPNIWPVTLKTEFHLGFAPAPF